MKSAVVSPPLIQRMLQSLVTLALAFLALAASSPAWADPPGRVGRIAETDGNVWLYDDEQAEWIQARRNRPVAEGDRLSAEQDARAEVQIGSATLRLDGGTDVEFTQLDDARVRVRVHGGNVALRVRGDRSAREFAIETSEGRYEPLRPGHYRVDVQQNSSIGETLAGAMQFEASDSVLNLDDGQRAEFWQENGVTHYAWSTPSSDRFGDWVARQDREDSRDRNRYVSPEMTGAEDLDRYGQWDRHPEYGAVWYPTTVVAGWAPYRYGHWAYLRPWGWTWVDDAPWGFAPFHYGRWVSYGGRWGWCPGQYVARPVYAPALVAWFGGPHVSVGINIGGPAVGWVPLAPREIYYPSYNVTNVYVRNVNVSHQRWYGPNPRYDRRGERAVPTGPIMYTNQGVAGGVTVVPQGVMQSRQPISRAAVPVDDRTVARWQAEAPRAAPGLQRSGFVPPAPPTARVVATPGGAVPTAPGAVRTPRWTGPAARVGAAQGDGGQARRSDRIVAPGARQPSGVPGGQRPGDVSGGAVNPPTTVQQVPAPRGTVQPRERTVREPGNRREERGERRVAPPVALPNVAPNTPQAAPPVVRPARPTVRPPAVVQPPDPPGNAAQAKQRAREQAEDRVDDRRMEIPRRLRDPRDQQAR
jgi:hypothetical protein